MSKEKKETKKKDVNQETEVAELKNLLQRLQADFENYRKRTQKEKEEFGRYLNEDLILQILPVLDNFKLAVKHLPKELEQNEWVHGIWHIEKQLEQVLCDQGVSAIGNLGETFDPNLHEAVKEISSKHPEGQIIEVTQTGYRIADRVIRPAKVVVSQGPPKTGDFRESTNEMER